MVRYVPGTTLFEFQAPVIKIGCMNEKAHSALHHARSRYPDRDRRFDDLGADGRVESMTIEIFHVQGPEMLSSHMLGILMNLHGTKLGLKSECQ